MEIEYSLKWLNENLRTDEDAINVFKTFKIIPESKICKKGLHEMKFVQSKGVLYWSCRKKGCSEILSVRKGTWLEGSKLSLQKILIFIYCWANDCATDTFGARELQLSKDTLTDFRAFLREVCASEIMEYDDQIGGPNSTVVLDVTQVSKKSTKNKQIQKYWAFFGKCTETGHIFLHPADPQDKESLKSCIKSKIVPGTTITSDLWEANGGGTLDGYSFQSQPQNNLDLGTEGSKMGVLEDSFKDMNKRNRGTKKELITSYLCELIWRNKHRDSDKFTEILKSIAKFEAS